MTTWVEDIVQALKNLGGQGTLNDIYSEVERIRKEPLSISWKASIRERIEAHSSDSRNFKGKDFFQKVGKGMWALRDQSSALPITQRRVKEQSTQIQSPPKSVEEISIALKTIKEYRDYHDPNSPTWNGYLEDVFHILGFSTEKINPNLMKLTNMETDHFPRAIVGLISPNKDFKEIVLGFTWESLLLFVANYYQIEWGIITNGLQLRVFSYRNPNLQRLTCWEDFDGIILNEKLDDFSSIYELFSLIKSNRKRNEKGRSNREIRVSEFWEQLLVRSKGRTSLFEKSSPSYNHWLSIGAGTSGLIYAYVIRIEDAHVELYIDRPDKDWNKRAFHFILDHKNQIEGSFGANMDWQDLPEKRACRIRYLISDYGLQDTEHWPDLQDRMIDVMIKFQKVMQPTIDEIKHRF